MTEPMTAATQTLTEFLLARIEEDERAAKRGLSKPQYGVGNLGDNAADEVIGMGYNEGCVKAGMKHFSRWMPARVLAECAAKRQIVELLEYDGSPEAWLTLRALASVWADHEDYREEWKL